MTNKATSVANYSMDVSLQVDVARYHIIESVKPSDDFLALDAQWHMQRQRTGHYTAVFVNSEWYDLLSSSIIIITVV